jgi:hypothetical protein
MCPILIDGLCIGRWALPDNCKTENVSVPGRLRGRDLVRSGQVPRTVKMPRAVEGERQSRCGYRDQCQRRYPSQHS